MSEFVVEVMLAVNEPSNGQMSDICHGINLWHGGDTCFEIEAYPDGVDFHLSEKTFRLGNSFGQVQVEYRNHRRGVGNWCWDSFLISQKGLVVLLEGARAMNLDLTVAFTPLYDAWNNGKGLEEAILEMLRGEDE